MKASDTYDIKHASNTYLILVITLFIMILIDLGINSTINFDDYSGVKMCRNKPACIGLQIILFMYKIYNFIFLNRISFCAIVFSAWILYLIMSGTYLYKVGLLGFLFKRLPNVIYPTIIYLILTITLGVLRILKSAKKRPLLSFWEPFFIIVYILQNIAAPIFYIYYIKAALILGDPIYYQREKWIKEFGRSYALEFNK